MRFSGSSDSSDWQGLVVICGGAAWDAWYPTEKHIAIHLSERTPILYVDPPTSFVARRRARIDTPVGLRIVGSRLAVLSPSTLPGQSHPLIARITRALTMRAIRRALRRLGASRAKALIVATHVDLLGAIEADTRVLYATDDFVAGAALLGLERRFLEDQERSQAVKADRVIVVTEALGERWRKLGHEPVLIPNGCDTARFETTDDVAIPEDIDLPAPRAGVFGHLSHRIDLSLLEAVAARGISLVLVGTVQPAFSLDSLLAFENVRYLGPKPFEEMPGYLRAVDVGLTPYAKHPFNLASFPLKTLEYLAAGRAAVSTALPAVAWLDTDLIATADDPEAFADATQAAIEAERTPELTERRRAFARGHSWASRAAEVAALIGVAASNRVGP